jgi:hypothetical protein
VLSLLIASAKSSYDTQASRINQMTAGIILLDLLLAQYGTEATEAREQLRHSIDPDRPDLTGKDDLSCSGAFCTASCNRSGLPKNPRTFA